LRNLSLVACLLCLFVAAPALADYSGGQVYYDRITGYYSGNGGEFTLSGTGLLLDLSAYSSLAKNQSNPTVPSFQTFCVETAEYVAQPMNIEVSTTFVDGTSGSHAVWGGQPNVGDDLDPMTAYFYTQFATGNLDGYNYGSGGYESLTRSQTAGALQRLIWSIEDEGNTTSLAAGTTVQGITLSADQANLIVDWLKEYANSGWTGIGNVRILNTYTTSGGLAQDQLYLLPVPAAVILGILGLCVAGIKLRKFA
jgi:hypothetical protein